MITKTENKKEITKLNHFIKLEYLIKILEDKRIYLTNGKNWDDRSDLAVLHEYKKAKNHEQLYIFCCLAENETIHHWKAYTDEKVGCCVQFNGKKLISHLERTSGLRHGHIEYKKINELKKGEIDLERYPFIKRHPYRCEIEYRFLWSGSHSSDLFPININLDLIDRITLLTKPSNKNGTRDFKEAENKITEALGTTKIRISKSTVYKNTTWINKFKHQ